MHVTSNRWAVVAFLASIYSASANTIAQINARNATDNQQQLEKRDSGRATYFAVGLYVQFKNLIMLKKSLVSKTLTKSRFKSITIRIYPHGSDVFRGACGWTNVPSDFVSFPPPRLPESRMAIHPERRTPAHQRVVMAHDSLKL